MTSLKDDKLLLMAYTQVEKKIISNLTCILQQITEVNL